VVFKKPQCVLFDVEIGLINIMHPTLTPSFNRLNETKQEISTKFWLENSNGKLNWKANGKLVLKFIAITNSGARSGTVG
jgi:hypothetical protein